MSQRLTIVLVLVVVLVLECARVVGSCRRAVFDSLVTARTKQRLYPFEDEYDDEYEDDGRCAAKASS